MRDLIIPRYEERAVSVVAPEQSGALRPRAGRAATSALRDPAVPSSARPGVREGGPRLRAALDAISGRARPVVVETGNDSGGLALELGTARPDALVYATDETGFTVRTRAALSGPPNVRFRLGALLEPLPLALRGAVDLVISSLPYAPPGLIGAVASVLCPAGTHPGLGADGLQLLRHLSVTAREFLVPGGSLVLQLASFQWYGFAQELVDFGYEAVQLLSRTNSVVTARAVWWDQVTPS